MEKTIKSTDIKKWIEDILTDYSGEVNEVLDEEITKVAKEAQDNLLHNFNIPERTGKYRKSFKRVRENRRGYVSKWRLYSEIGRLTHLLEKGHDIVRYSGGDKNASLKKRRKSAVRKTYGRTKAYPHWADAQKIVDALPDRITEALKK